MRNTMLAMMVCVAMVGCGWNPDPRVSIPRPLPLSSPPKDIKFSRTFVNKTMTDTDELIVIEMNGKRYVVLEVNGGSRALVKLLEEDIKP